jgi:peptidoglycan hydrolase-like protein with peptidoglycan-binding domain
VITNEFLQNNCVVAIAFAYNIDNGELDTSPFLYDLEFGSSDKEVARLQSVLREIGHFPESVSSTGYYGTVTQKAVLDFQLEWNVLFSENDAGAGRFGPLTRKTLNDLLQTNL